MFSLPLHHPQRWRNGFSDICRGNLIQLLEIHLTIHYSVQLGLLFPQSFSHLTSRNLSFIIQVFFLGLFLWMSLWSGKPELSVFFCLCLQSRGSGLFCVLPFLIAPKRVITVSVSSALYLWWDGATTSKHLVGRTKYQTSVELVFYFPPSLFSLFSR